MSFTRFHDDPERIKKQLQQSTGSARYIMNVPGPGDALPFLEDPQIRMQKWGANLHTNTCDLESELRGLGRTLNRDEIKHTYSSFSPHHHRAMAFPTSSSSMTDESRATHPAYELREIQLYRPDPLMIDPQQNVEIPFFNNLNTRILEKDNHITTFQSLELTK